MFDALLASFRRFRYPGNPTYWEHRYADGGHSGAGSSGLLAQYKALVINDILSRNQIETLVELGCGDGQQLSLGDYPDYLGLDISPTAVEHCRSLFSGDPGKRFAVYDPKQFDPEDCRAELSLSMEVIFHLTEQEGYEVYMRHLFAAAERLVVIFSSDEADATGGIYPHFKPRRFTADLPRIAPGWVLREKIINPHRHNSRSDFFVFERAIKG